MGASEVTIEEVRKKQGKVQIVDVRQAFLFGQEHVDKVEIRNIPLIELPQRVQELDKSKRVYVICNHGNASKQGAAFLEEQGFTAFSVAGGTRGWKEKYPKEMYESARYTLFRTFDVTLKIFSPIMPHITEKLYQSFFKKYDSKQSIHLTNWPTIREASDENSEKAGDLLIKIIDDVRKMKSENKLAMNKEIKSVVVSADDAEMFAELIEDLKQTVNAKEVQYKQGEFKVDIVV